MIKQNFIRMMGVLVLMLLILFPGHAFGNSWEQLSEETAKDIGIGANGSVWIVGTNTVSGGYGIYRWDGENWEGVDGGAVRIDVDPQGNPWIVNANGNIYKRIGNRWEPKQLPETETAEDIGIGAKGSVWIVGTNTVSGGYSIYRLDGENWEGVDGDAVRIDVDPQGNPWIVNANGNIYRRVGNRWEQLFGTAKDIGIGANGSVWIVGTNTVSGGYGIYKWDGKNWEGVDGGAFQISVDRDGIPWVVDSLNHIYIYKEKRSFWGEWLK